MSLFTNNIVFDIITIISIIIVAIIFYIKRIFNYWERIGIESVKPTFPFGSAKNLFLGKISFCEQFLNFYKTFRSKNLKHGGVFIGIKPFYMPLDPEIIKHILTKDFQYFTNHGTYYNEEYDPLSAHLFNLEDQEWKNMRVKLTPTFTSSKMKMMFNTLLDCSKGMQDIMQEASQQHKPVEIKDILTRFTTDIIGSCAFGLECNSLKHPDTEFRLIGRRIFENTTWEKIRFSLTFAIPRWLLNLARFKANKQDVEDFLIKTTQDNVEYREKNQIFRKDFLHLLIQLKNYGKVVDEKVLTNNDGNMESLTINQLAAQCFVFFAAGFETSGTTMTFALFELSRNPRIQEKLRQEIHQILEKYNGNLTYNAIMEMTFLEQVIQETLRKYPPISVLNRRCSRAYKIPGTSIVLEEGTDVAISTTGLHNDPEYFPNPDEFIPERFTDENRNKRPPFTWIPFGEGPRICIGLRFGMMQAKVGISSLLRNYKFTLNNKTPIPVQMDKGSFITAVDGGIWLNVETIN